MGPIIVIACMYCRVNNLVTNSQELGLLLSANTAECGQGGNRTREVISEKLGC